MEPSSSASSSTSALSQRIPTPISSQRSLETLQGSAPSSPLTFRPHNIAGPPLPLTSFRITIEFRRHPEYTPSDEPAESYPVPISILVHDQYRLIASDSLRAGHLSWDKFGALVSRKFPVFLTQAECELGWRVPAPCLDLSDEYVEICDELAFQNAISVMQSTSSGNPGFRNVTLYLWHPRRCSRAFQTPVLSSHSPIIPSASIEPDTERHPSASLPGPEHPPLLGTPEIPIPPLQPSNHQASRPVPQPASSPAARPAPPVSLPSGIDFDPTHILKDLETNDWQRNKPVRDFDETDDEWNARYQEWLDVIVESNQAKLSHGLDSTACMQLSLQIWIQVCDFFHHDVSKHEPDYIVQIRGFARKLLPVQALTVWHALQMFNGPAGAVFVGHIMGIGKTTIALATHYIQHQMNKVYQHIERTPAQHYQSNQHSPNAVCPSQQEIFAKFGVDCPCVSTSPTYFVKQRLGVSVALAPLALLDTWIYEGLQCFPPSKDGQPHEVQVVKAHGSMIAPDLQSRIVGEEDLFEQAGTNLPAPSEYQPRLENGSVFIISTSQSFVTRFLDVFRNRKSWTVHPPGVLKTRANGTQYTSTPHPIVHYTPYYRTAVICIIFRDECHLERTRNAASIKVIQTIINGQEHTICLMPMSGTALTFGPQDIAQYVKLAARRSWERDPILKHWLNDECTALGKRWEANCTTKGDLAELDQIITRFQPLVERLFIRFTNQSDFLGSKPVKVPQNKLITLRCDNGDWTARVEGLREQEDARLQAKERRRKALYVGEHRGSEAGYEPLKRNAASSYYRARLCASLPALMELNNQDGELLKLTEGEWLDHQAKNSSEFTYWKPETESDPYFRNLDDIVNSSAKLREIGKIITQLKDVRDAEKKPCRQVWCSYFFTGAYVMYLWMVHILKIPKDEIIFLNKTMTQKKITDQLARFHVDLTKERDKQPPTARYIVATSSSFSVGITLSEALTVGFLEPDFRLATMLQGFARHTRQGNKNPVTYSYLCEVAGNRVEERIVEVSKLRGSIDAATARKTGSIGIEPKGVEIINID